jgi:RNA polymerase-binding transcription factor DksA
VRSAGSSSNRLETRQTVQRLAGRLVIGNSEYDVVRPFVSTANAKVEIAGDEEAERLPAYQAPNPSDLTYRDWLLHKLDLPEVRVPRTASRSESELSPVTVNDYLMYCYLQQEEIDKSVFGHNEYFKNIKRMAVFDIVYGRYDAELAGLREQLREVSSELRRLQNWFQTIDEFIEGTLIENRTVIECRVRETEAELESFEDRLIHLADEAIEETGSTELRDELRQAKEAFARVRTMAESEATGVEQKDRLIAQLRTQSARLTKAIVADEYLLDFDFVMCPRCGSEVGVNRSTDGDPGSTS